MSLSNIIQDISKGWLDYRNHCKSTSKTGADIKIIKQDHDIFDLVINQWPKTISNNVDLKKYTIESSLGKGLLAAGPWLTVMDKTITESATEGFYVVYLFSRSAKKLYLSIGIGATQFQEIYGITNKCLDKIKIATEQFRNLFKQYKPANTIESIDLLEDKLTFENPIKGTARNLVSCYERGSSFSKEYNIDQINDEILKKDLDTYINIYSNIVEDPKAENLDIIAETTIDEEDEKEISKNKKNISLDYDIPQYSPREKKNKKKTKKISIVKQSKQRRKTQESKKIGDAGEAYVYKYEYNKLIKANRSDLAKKIDMHCARYHYPGWDITSYGLNGKEIYIEVKSTKGKVINDFDITDPEWQAAKKQGDKYHIYLVNNVLNKDAKIFERIQNPALHVAKKKILLTVAIWNLKLN